MRLAIARVSAASAPTGTLSEVTFKAKDGTKIRLSLAAAELMGMADDTLERAKTYDPKEEAVDAAQEGRPVKRQEEYAEMPMPDYSAQALTRLAEGLEQLVTPGEDLPMNDIPKAPFPESQKTLREALGSKLNADNKTAKYEWYIIYASKPTTPELVELINVVNLVHVDPLLYLLCAELGMRLRDKTANQIRKELGIANPWEKEVALLQGLQPPTTAAMEEMFKATAWCGPETAAWQVVGPKAWKEAGGAIDASVSKEEIASYA